MILFILLGDGEGVFNVSDWNELKRFPFKGLNLLFLNEFL